MSGYNEIRGLRVKYLSADPANPENGQVWYKSTTGNLRVQGIGVAAWSSAAPLSLGRRSVRGAGTQTAGLAIGGTDDPSATPTGATEEYNGSGWTTGGSLSTARHSGASAVNAPQTAALYASGTPPITTATEEYNGSTWTAGGAIGTGRQSVTGFGIQTAAVAAGGNAGPGYITATEEYDGSTWTAGGALPANRAYLAGFGLQTAGIAAGGSTAIPAVPNATNTAFSYDGSTWTATPNLPTAGIEYGAAGVQTSGIIFAGNTAALTKTIDWNGTTWSDSSASLADSKSNRAGAGSSSAAFAAGGGPVSGVTEEYNFSSSTVTAAAWSSGGNLSGLARNYNVGCGINTAGLSVGGFNPGSGALTLSEEYNGSTWANGGTLGTASYDSGVSGTQTAALKAGNLPGYPTATEEYDGSTWTAGGALSTGRAENAASGIQTASLAISGGLPPAGLTANVESYDGTSWTEGPNVNTARRGKPGGSGTSTAALFYGGYTNPPSPANMQSATESYDGTSWSEVNNLIEARFAGGPAQNGTQTSSLYAAGYTPANSASNTANGWDGTSWSTKPSMAQGVRHLGGAGSGNTSAMIFGGFNGTARVQSTEEFTGETVTVNPASNLSVS